MQRDETKRLMILVDHWIRHNRDHTSEYLRVAERLESEGLAEIATRIRKASEIVLRANERLSAAKDTLAQYQKGV
ncbi:MAG: hypothetical protein JRJ42_04205 [Deltaproteobacteria bacterium]|nr:hypothetical protein [Deltaproteobacteria bacterium]MBW2018633.1 hypothetical protein [Deltaproteobacteria bacterium]MBW2073899.1 hypothetical protein [Deltaproteobacteria bacterium]RLB81858.1 MAG: hypothetical protein DRH17_07820 [Deltaproteobacteria bacterium]